MHALPRKFSWKRWQQQQQPVLLLLLQLLQLLLQLATRGLEAQQATGGDCVTFFPADAAVLSYCKNGAKCGVNISSGTLLELVCDCSALQTTERFYAGPDCSIEQKMNYVMGSLGSDVPNTCWLENLLGLNQWKDVGGRVSAFCYTVPCPSPDSSSA